MRNLTFFSFGYFTIWPLSKPIDFTVTKFGRHPNGDLKPGPVWREICRQIWQIWNCTHKFKPGKLRIHKISHQLQIWPKPWKLIFSELRIHSNKSTLRLLDGISFFKFQIFVFNFSLINTSFETPFCCWSIDIAILYIQPLNEVPVLVQTREK